ncbi:MAG: hypothetical protein GFH27_549301n289 [Chloroflexi bacterium AL-W]|nr:hypothetical protein [Chloroflexi bacterium AL-N1]NOK68483.1 hypothetical protein [Chloroflexi bacterium AL-N10]NOK74129.1 hypothetical protein [Chloroflexi bacterium AL-N5]NOK83096.1 hypothetical protein [Chloroflexi bacterium AL-W]NOK90619.1 hypothetical protein [Chloroflexi bacterium AL-N15]
MSDQAEQVTTHQSKPEAMYHTRCATFEKQRDRYSHQASLNANISLGLFFITMIFMGLGVWQGTILPFAIAAFFGICLVVSFVNHGRVNRQHCYYDILYKINDEGRHRLRRDWDNLPLRQPPGDQQYGQSLPTSGAELARPYANDLDILGHASLQHLLGTPVTPAGQATLQQWLLNPADPTTIRQRQEAVAELASQVDFRDDLALRGRLLEVRQDNYEEFLQWAEDENWLLKRPWLIWLARLLTVVTLGLLVAQLLSFPVYPILIAVAAVNLLLTFTIGRKVNAIIERVAAQNNVFEAYANLFQIVTTHTFTSPALQTLLNRLSSTQLRADQEMRRMGRIMPLAEIRGWMFFLFIQLATLWTFHVLWLLERWQRSAGPYTRTWLTALGDIEALTALATLAHDHPDWVFPEMIDNHAPRVTGSNVGHPLLAPAVCVGNDIEIGPPGTFLLITGSNMSGKSTLLRSIGVNTVLAQAGGPVCASSLCLAPTMLATTMRVQDSLEQGISFFMAELKRLKAVYDTTREAQTDGQFIPLFLLDEILQGTNTAERQIAARQIILHLLELGGTGAVSTHDLALADTPELKALSRPFYFTEHFTRGPEGLSMNFDYQLRPGIATSTNALKLVELVGLPLEDVAQH